MTAIRKQGSIYLIYLYANFLEIITIMGDKTVAIATATAGLLISLFRRYLFADVTLLPTLVIFILLDAWAGWTAVKYLNRKDPMQNPPATGPEFRDKLAMKSTSYVIALIMLNNLLHLEIMGIRPLNFLQGIEIVQLGFELRLDMAIYFSTVLGFIYREIRSINGHLNTVGFRLFGKRTLNRLDQIVDNKDE